MKKLLLLLTVLILASCGGPAYPDGTFDALGKCLTENNIKMYGAFWCPHCQHMKKTFGSSFKHVTYVECDPRGENSQTDLCLEKKIEKYATFRKETGETLCCEPTPEELAEFSGCPVTWKD